MVRAYVYAGLVIPLCAVAGFVACSDPANTSLPDLAPSPAVRSSSCLQIAVRCPAVTVTRERRQRVWS
jgi:hypothetical protein